MGIIWCRGGQRTAHGRIVIRPYDVKIEMRSPYLFQAYFFSASSLRSHPHPGVVGTVM